MSIEIGSALQTLRTRPERCQLCRNGYAEANVVIEVRNMMNDLVKHIEALACGECAALAFTNLEMAIERTVTEMKEVDPSRVAA